MPGGESRLEVEVDAHAVRLALKRLDPEAEKLIRSVVKSTTTKGRRIVRTGAPQRSGLLAASVRSYTRFNQKQSRGVVTVNGPARRYAWIVEHGSKAAHNRFEGFGYIAKANREIDPQFQRDIKEAVDDAIKVAGLTD